MTEVLGKLHHFGLTVTDMDRSKAFYGSILEYLGYAPRAADSREQVDRFYEHLKSIDADILNAPAEYGYMPGFYAVFFTDPDGVKLELAHTPDFPPA